MDDSALGAALALGGQFHIQNFSPLGWPIQHSTFRIQNPESSILSQILMRILYINHTALKSGAAISLGTLVKNLPAEVIPCFLLRKGSQVDEILGATGDVPRYHARWIAQYLTTLYGKPLPFPQFFWQLVKTPLALTRAGVLARKWNCDIVHVSETMLPADAAGAALAGLPVFVHARTALNDKPFERGVLENLARFRRLRFIAIDDEVKDSLPPRSREKCTVVHNPIHLGPPPSAAAIAEKRASWGIGPEHTVVGQLASLHSAKGIWDILDIATRLCARHPSLRFVLVGDKDPHMGEGPALEAAISARGLQAQVLLPGYDRDLSTIYGALDIALCLFGAGLGGVGRSAYEAAIAGRALVATLPGARTSKTLTHERHGLLYEPDDLDGVRDGIEKLILNPGLRTSLGTTAKEEIGARHDPSNVAAKMLALYREAVGRSAADG